MPLQQLWKQEYAKVHSHHKEFIEQFFMIYLIINHNQGIHIIEISTKKKHKIHLGGQFSH